MGKAYLLRMACPTSASYPTTNRRHGLRLYASSILAKSPAYNEVLAVRNSV